MYQKGHGRYATKACFSSTNIYSILRSYPRANFLTVLAASGTMIFTAFLSFFLNFFFELPTL